MDVINFWQSLLNMKITENLSHILLRQMLSGYNFLSCFAMKKNVRDGFHFVGIKFVKIAH